MCNFYDVQFMMDNTRLDDTPGDVDLSMSYTCMPPELPTAYRVTHFITIASVILY